MATATRIMGPRTRNTLLSGMAAIAAVLTLAALALWTGAVSNDYVRVSWFLFAMTVIWIVVVVTVSLKEDEQIDRAWLGAIFGIMTVVSLIAGLGIHFALFANEETAKLVFNIATTVDAVLAIVAWIHTNFVNDDFVI
jgi:NADH:ubiquinone oxidoreductase subunit 6 (subunit J)